MMSTYRLFLLTTVITAPTAYQSNPSPNADGNECGLVGKWRNQLNSTLVISWCFDGQVRGRYESAVGHALSSYNLTGSYTRGKVIKTTIVIGWTVAYNNRVYGNSESVCAWSGLYYAEDRKIYTHWILSYATKRADYWESKHINSDTFERMQ